MGKRKKDEKSRGEAELSNSEDTNNLKKQKNEKLKKSNNIIPKNTVSKSPELNKNFKSNSNSGSESSSSSDSESENKNDKKTVSDTETDSDSESSDSSLSSSTPRPKNDKVKPTEGIVKNSVTNLSPVKSYNPPPKSSSSDSYHSDTEEEDKKRRKKQKKLLKLQLNKKAKKASQTKVEVKSEIFDDVDIKEELDDDGIDNIASTNDDVPDWPEADYYELLRRMEAQIPSKDNQKFDSRAAKLDWNAVAFGDYTASDCHDVWNRISKRIRRFRLLGEMLTDAKDWVTKPWTNFYRGSKKNRHPDMPTRPLSTYMIYYLEQKDKVAKENPGLEMTQVSKIISEMYKGLTMKERERYTEMATRERANYDEKLSGFYKEHPDMVPQPQSRSSAKEIALKGPRKPNPPFKLFFQEQLKQYDDGATLESVDKKAIEEAAKEKWRNLSDKKKLIFINWALEDSRRYQDELKVYMLEHPDFVPPGSGKPLKSILNKEERTIKERLSGKPIKPPNSAYSLYSRVMLQSDPSVKKLPPKERMAEISKKWKEISDSQKQRYEEKVRQMQDNYKLEFASYLEGLSPEEREEELQQNQPKRKGAAAAAAAAAATAAAAAAASVKIEDKPVKRRTKPINSSVKTPVLSSRSPAGLCLYKGEPEPPPVKVFDLFLKSFLSEKPAGTSEETRLKEAPQYWDILPDAKKDVYRKKLAVLKKKYIKDYEVFLKSLSPEELKEFSLLKHKAKQMEEAQEQLGKVNGTLSDSNEESDEDDKKETSSESDSDDSDSGKSTKSSSSSEESE